MVDTVCGFALALCCTGDLLRRAGCGSSGVWAEGASAALRFQLRFGPCDGDAGELAAGAGGVGSPVV